MTDIKPYTLFEAVLRQTKCIPRFEREYRFAPPRRWRIDFAFPDVKLAVEIEGGIWIKGGHTRGSGFMKNVEKYNALALLGWRLLRFTPEQVENTKYLGDTLKTIQEFFLRDLTETIRQDISSQPQNR